MGLFKKLTEAVNSVDNFANKFDEAINTATSKIDSAVNSLDQKLNGYNSNEETVSTYSSAETFFVPEGITEIDEETFENYKGEKVIVLPSTLEKLAYNSFYERCSQVEHIDFSKVTKLTTISEYLFSDLKYLREIVVPEGVTNIETEVFHNSKRLKKIVFPSTLEAIDGGIDGCPALQEIVFPKECKLKELPEYFLSENNKIGTFVIPYGIETVGDSIWYRGDLKELYVPPTVTEIGAITEEFENKVDVYLYAYNLDDINELSADAKTLYVMPEAFNHYQELIDEREAPDNNHVVLKVMPSEKMYFYGEPQPIVYQQQAKEVEAVAPPLPSSMPEMAVKEAKITQILSSIADNAAVHNEEKHAVKAPQVVKRPGQLFSDGLEELINAVVATGELTDKKREIILRHAIKEGEDPDEVEMVLDARIYESKNK